MLKKTLITAFGLLLLIGFLGSVKFAPGFGQFAAMAAEGARMVMPPPWLQPRQLARKSGRPR
jgi:hypothetical protein